MWHWNTADWRQIWFLISLFQIKSSHSNAQGIKPISKHMSMMLMKQHMQQNDQEELHCVTKRSKKTPGHTPWWTLTQVTIHCLTLPMIRLLEPSMLLLHLRIILRRRKNKNSHDNKHDHDNTNAGDSIQFDPIKYKDETWTLPQS